MLVESLVLDIVAGAEVEASWTSPCGARYVARWRGSSPADAAELRNALARLAAAGRFRTFDQLLDCAVAKPFVVTTHGRRCRDCVLLDCPGGPDFWPRRRLQ